jgi:hypothetical protein
VERRRELCRFCRGVARGKADLRLPMQCVFYRDRYVYEADSVFRFVKLQHDRCRGASVLGGVSFLLGLFVCCIASHLYPSCE